MSVETRNHREQRAKRYEAKASEKELEAKREGASDVAVRQVGRWYRSRAAGQRARFDRCKECQTDDEVRVVCQGCGLVVENPARCRTHLACVSCRGKIASEKRARFLSARWKVLGAARVGGLLRHDRKGGRYSEKLVTLTMPHVERLGVRERIDTIKAAWPIFLKQFNVWLRGRHAAERSHWLRNFEWTPGEDEKGHPHIHFWFFGPYLPAKEESAARVKYWWRIALMRVGLTREETESMLYPDVRAIRDGEAGAAEVVKYMTKDLVKSRDGKGKPELIAPARYAPVYESLDGKRVTQGSRGFLKLADKAKSCGGCGATGMFRVKVGPRASAEGQDGQAAWCGEVERTGEQQHDDRRNVSGEGGRRGLWEEPGGA
jgi:hypothetical protein